MKSKTQHLRQNLLFGFLVVGLFLALPALTFAAPGDLDTTFGTGGKVFMPINIFPKQVRIQPDGKIVTLGVDTYDEGYSFISRHNTDGTADTTFGAGGYILLDYLNGNGFFSDFVIQSDGKFLVIGGKDFSFALFRFNSNGTRDTGFGTNGLVTTQINYGVESEAYGIALQSDGRIIATGLAQFYGPSGPRLVLVRYHPAGTLDTSFGINGTVVETEFSWGTEILVQPDGKLIVVSRSGFIARYNSNGTPDDSFGTNGKVNTGIYSHIALQADGKIVVTGKVSQLLSVIKRYNQNGTPDTSFGTDGIVSINEPNPSPNSLGITLSLAIQKNGKILTAGQRNGTFAISHYNSDGTIDTTFGTNGLVVTPLGNNNTYNVISALTLQPDGKIVAAGYVVSDNIGYATLARYLSDPINTSFDFDGDGKADVSIFRPSNGAWYLNQSINGFTVVGFGVGTDKIVPADYDGDGKTDIAVFRDGVWYWLNSSNGNFNAVQFGQAGDIPVPADYTGDGRAELAVYRGGTWFTLNLTNNQSNAAQFGNSTDKPVVADYDGDGKSDYAVYRTGIWYLLQSTQGFAAIQFGTSTDKLVPADYDGDGKTDFAVYRDGIWYLLRSQAGFTMFQFGLSTDIPAPADYDGDGRTDAAVYRNGTWYLQQSTNGFAAQQFGLSNDKPVPTAYLP